MNMANKSLTNEQKKDWAKMLFLRENLMQKEIADKVGVSQKTMSAWVTRENWNQLRSSLIITKEEELRRIYMQINELNTYIFSREEGQRFANSKEADTLNKLAATARSLETDLSLSETIEVFKQFLNHIKKDDLARAQEITRYCDDFIRHLLR